MRADSSSCAGDGRGADGILEWGRGPESTTVERFPSLFMPWAAQVLVAGGRTAAGPVDRGRIELWTAAEDGVPLQAHVDPSVESSYLVTEVAIVAVATGVVVVGFVAATVAATAVADDALAIVVGDVGAVSAAVVAVVALAVDIVAPAGPATIGPVVSTIPPFLVPAGALFSPLPLYALRLPPELQTSPLRPSLLRPPR